MSFLSDFLDSAEARAKQAAGNILSDVIGVEDTQLPPLVRNDPNQNPNAYVAPRAPVDNQTPAVGSPSIVSSKSPIPWNLVAIGAGIIVVAVLLSRRG